MKKTKAFVIAAIRSGSGKTTLTVGIMAALVKRGLNVQPFKIGPDFIDPTLHKSVTGIDSFNIDMKMMGAKCCRKTFYEKITGADVAVVEGVMGLFDGGIASTAETAALLGLPVVLIVDAASCAESAVAVMKGFEQYDERIKLAGVIFNKIGSERHRELIENEVKRKSNVPIIGFVYRDSELSIPERHLGLVMGRETKFAKTGFDEISKTVESSLDLGTLLLQSVDIVSPMKNEVDQNKIKSLKKRKIIALASDEAFCFYYPQNIELLEKKGFEIIEFSPIRDRSLPKNTDMIYFGGGYPELFAESLSNNTEIRENIKNHFDDNIPVYGECGGFMYLCEKLTDLDGNTFPMVALFPFSVIMNKKLRKLGYRKITLKSDCLLGKKGDFLHGHEFHYSHIENIGSEKIDKGLERLYLLDNNSCEGYSTGSAIGSYIHLHFGRTPGAVEKMYE